MQTPCKFIIAELSIRNLGSSSVLIILLIIISANNSIISTDDEDPSLRIESSAIINLRGVSTKLIKQVNTNLPPTEIFFSASGHVYKKYNGSSILNSLT